MVGLDFKPGLFSLHYNASLLWKLLFGWGSDWQLVPFPSPFRIVYASILLVLLTEAVESTNEIEETRAVSGQRT